MAITVLLRHFLESSSSSRNLLVNVKLNLVDAHEVIISDQGAGYFIKAKNMLKYLNVRFLCIKVRESVSAGFWRIQKDGPVSIYSKVSISLL